jgi:hypothetical protein
LVIQEVKGPSFPSKDRLPPLADHISEPTTPKPAIERLCNYKNDDLRRLLPRHFTNSLHDGNHLQIERHSLTQESFIADGSEADQFDTPGFDDDVEESTETVYLFEQSTLARTSHQSDAREFLKATYNELIGCLDSLKNEETHLHVAGVLAELVIHARSKLGKNLNRKRLLDTRTVNIMIEQQPNSVRQNYASRNC